MKKKITIIIIIIILLVSVVFSLLYINNKEKTTKENEKIELESKKIYTEVKNEIDTKNNLLLFVTSTKVPCDTCKDATRFVKYYEDIYNLDIVYFDKSLINDKYYKKIEKYLGVESNFVVPPAVIIVKNKHWFSIVNDMPLERELKKFLAEADFLDDKELNIETQITKFEFDDIYNNSKPSLILFYNNTEKSYSYRKNLLDLSKKYNFDYNILYNDLYGGLEVTRRISDEEKIDIEFPMLLLVQNSKVIDYTTIEDTNKTLDFLRKNNIIN